MTTLLNKAIRLAYENPRLRKDLLPFLREASQKKTVSGTPIPESKKDVGDRYLDAWREALSFARAAENARDDAGRISQHSMAAHQHYYAAQAAKELGDLKAQKIHESLRKDHISKSDAAKKRHGPAVGVPKGLPDRA